MSSFGKRILILVPHPDDEVVGFCAAIGRAQAEGAQVFALYLTHGCIARETLWPWQRHRYPANVARRFLEGKQVAALLGLTAAGYAERPARHLWRNLPEVYAEIRTAIAKHQIDQLWVPTYEGGNADHDGLNGLCHHLRGELSILEFAEYHFRGGKKNAQSFPFPNGTETILSLTPEEQAHKRKALELYASEKLNLNYVGTSQESYRPLAEYDYSKPPHEGTVWYARFHWVPFSHPRVDFTTPRMVCDALAAFEPTSDLPESATQ